MAIFLVTHPSPGVATLIGGNAMVVSATDAADARAIAASQYGGDSGGWATATATELTDTAVTATGALTGWQFEITIFHAVPKVFTLVAAGAGQDTLDEIGTALAVLCNADDDIANAGYTAGTQALIVAGVADGLGDLVVTCTVKPVVVTAAGGQVNDPKNIPGFVASITDEGISGADLVVTFAEDTLLVPAVKAVLNTA